MMISIWKWFALSEWLKILFVSYDRSTEISVYFSCVHCTMYMCVYACMYLRVFYFILGTLFTYACNEHTPANVCECVCASVVEYCTHIAKSPIIKYHGVIAVVVVVVLIAVIVIVVSSSSSSCFNHPFPVNSFSYTHSHINLNAIFSHFILLFLRSSFLYFVQKESRFLFIPFSFARYLHNTLHALYVRAACSVHIIDRIVLFS